MSKKSQSYGFVWILLVISGVIIFGIFISFAMIPSIDGPQTNSILTKYDNRSIRKKILDWIPKHHTHLVSDLPGYVEESPDWRQQFWTPIDIEVSSDPTVTLCKLNFKEYSQNPHMYSMFRDFVTLSKCMGSNRKRESLSTLMKELDSSNDSLRQRTIKPTGFIFHESRVGSTLVANLLGSDPWTMVFSESAPAANALLHCDGCSLQKNIKIFRDVITLMGRSPFHKRMFLKFQSITTTKMEVALQVRFSGKNNPQQLVVRRFPKQLGHLFIGSQFKL